MQALWTVYLNKIYRGCKLFDFFTNLWSKKINVLDFILHSQYACNSSLIDKAADNFSLMILKKKRTKDKNKQIEAASGIISLRGIEPLKAKTSFKEGRKRSSGTANNIVTQPTHPLLTLLSHHIVKITVRSVSLLRTAGENVGLCGWWCVLTILRAIKKEIIWHSSSI